MAFERAQAEAASEWMLREPPKEWVKRVGPVTLVAYRTSTCPAVLDRDWKLELFVAVSGGGCLRLLSGWAPTLAAATALGDRLLAEELNEYHVLSRR